MNFFQHQRQAKRRSVLLVFLMGPALLNAMTRCVMHEGVITVAKAELFRAAADLVDCPLPPFLVTEPDTGTSLNESAG